MDSLTKIQNVLWKMATFFDPNVLIYVNKIWTLYSIETLSASTSSSFYMLIFRRITCQMQSDILLNILRKLIVLCYLVQTVLSVT